VKKYEKMALELDDMKEKNLILYERNMELEELTTD